MDDFLDGLHGQALGGVHQEVAGVGDGEADTPPPAAGAQLETEMSFGINNFCLARHGSDNFPLELSSILDKCYTLRMLKLPFKILF